MKGLYFYKLVSPYSEDVTKDCKLNINEIDSNFITLKNADIKDVYVDNDNKKIILYRNDGEELVCDLSEMTEHPKYQQPSLSVTYDNNEGVITIEYEGEEPIRIDRLITKDNLSKELLTRVYSDSTIEGNGTSENPLRLASVQKTGHYKPAIRIVDTTIGEKLPKHNLSKGDRYVVYEDVSDYGLLYNFHDVEYLNDLLKDSGWRVPTKKDWDNMLNALEPCEFRNHNVAINNTVLGKYAGKLLKSTFDWRTPLHGHNHKECSLMNEDDFDVEFDAQDCKKRPEQKPVSPNGVDAYGMTVLPSGFAYFASPIQYNFFGMQGAFWTSDMLHDTDVYAKVFDSRESGVMQIAERPSAYLSIRLVKDYDGANHKGVEGILGQNYQTVLMPSLNNPNGYTIWMAQNLNAKGKNQCSVVPNAGLSLETRKVYFIHEWNGFGWDRVEMEEGDAITILEGKHHNEAYRVIDGVLVNITDYILDTINSEYKDIFAQTTARIDKIEEIVDNHEQRLSSVEITVEEAIAARTEEINKLTERIEAEEQKRHDEVERLDVRIDNETASRKNRDNELQEAIGTETESRKRRDNELQDAIDTEHNSRLDAVLNLQNQIDSEVQSRKNNDEQLQQSIAEEVQTRQNEIQQIYNALEVETTSRKNRDSELQEAIDTEIAKRQRDVQDLYDAITTETTSRKRRDNELQDSIDAEVAKRKSDVQDLWDETARIDTKLDKEVERAVSAEEALNERTENLEGKSLVGTECIYDEKTGNLTLKAVDDKNTIVIPFCFNFGEC